MAFIQGEDLILYLWDGSAAYEPVACLTSNSIEMTRGIIESQTKCDPGVTIKNPGIMSYSIPFEGEYIVQESGKLSFDDQAIKTKRNRSKKEKSKITNLDILL